MQKMIDLIQKYSYFHKVFFRAWKLERWLRIAPTRFCFLAKHQHTKECRVFLIMESPLLSAHTFRQLSKISDSNLLLPDRYLFIQKIAILQFENTKTLKELVQEQELSLRQIFQLGLDITKALDALHQSGYVHLDISPDNIFVTKEQRFLLGDFSNCRKTNAVTKHPPEYTKGYSAPECYQNQYSPLSDQFSLTALLYSLCNDGEPPTQNHTDLSDCQLAQIHPELSKRINPFFEKSLSQNPDRRFPDLSSYQESLQSILYHLPESPLYSFHIPTKAHPFMQVQTALINSAKSPIVSQKPKRIPYFLVPLFLFIAFTVLLYQRTSFKPEAQTPQPTHFPRSVSSPTPSSASSPTSSPASLSATEPYVKTELDISHSKISSLTETIDGTIPLDQITVLYGEDNTLQNVEELSAFSSLEELYLSNNKIIDTRDFCSLHRLKILILSDNDCTDLSGLASLKTLTFLDLSGNSHLSNPEILFSLAQLDTLVLTDTNLSSALIEQLQKKLPKCQIIF